MLIFCDGVDDGLGALGKWDQAYFVNAVSSSGRTGTSCYQIGDYSSGHTLRRSLGADEHATVTLGAAIFPTGINAFWNYDSAKGHMEFRSDGGTTFHIRVVFDGGDSNTSPRISVYRGSGNGSLLTSVAVPTWVANQWYYMETQVVLHDTNGSVIVKINGTTYVNLTSVDTKNGGTKTVIDTIGFACPGVNNNHRIDDIYVTNGAGSVNTGFLGDVAVETIYPNADGLSSQWVGSDGNSVNNYLLVDENGTPNTTDYVQSATAGHKDLYEYGSLVRTAGTIYGVAVSSYAQKSDSGAVSIKNVISSGGTEDEDTAVPLVTTYLPVISIFENDPNTSAPWTVAGVNAVEAGVKVA